MVSITIKDERLPCFQPTWRFDFKETLVEQYTLHHSPSGPPHIIKLNNSIPSHIMDILKLLNNSCVGLTPFLNIIQSSQIQISVPVLTVSAKYSTYDDKPPKLGYTPGLLQNEMTELIWIKNKQISKLENENKEKDEQIDNLKKENKDKNQRIWIGNKIINGKDEQICELENENKEKHKQICELENDLIYFVRKPNYKTNTCIEYEEDNEEDDEYDEEY